MAKELQEFKCSNCGCTYWVEDRNSFVCPNCAGQAKSESTSYELIEIYGEFKESGEKLDGVTAAIGQYDGSFEDDYIFYWFDSYDKVIGEHEDFTVRRYIDSRGIEHPAPKKKVSVRYLKSGAITMFIPENLTPDEELKYCEDILNVTPDEELAEGLKEREDAFFDETPEIEALEDVENDYDEIFSSQVWDKYTKRLDEILAA